MKSLFYGMSVSALCGLALGLALHGPWHDAHAGGPRLLFSRAEAAEPDHAIDAATPPEADSSFVATQDVNVDTATDTGLLPADPLPVTRLTRRGGEPIVEAAAADVERAPVETAEQDEGVITVGDLHEQTPPPNPATASEATLQTEDGGR